MLFKTFKRGKGKSDLIDLVVYANYEYDRLCFILVPLKGKINLRPRLQNRVLVPFRGHFQRIRRATRG